MRSRSLDTQSTGVQHVLTRDDEEHLEDYARRLDEAIAVLNEEISAINQGKYHVVAALFEQKSAVLKWLELRAPLIEPFSTHQAAHTIGLPEKLSEFKDILERNGELLSNMSNAAATIVREIERVLNRNSLDGIYGSSGEKLSKGSKKRMALDQEI